MTPFRSGVITAFYNPDTGRSWGIYLSTDGIHPGGGANTTAVYTGSARVDAMVSYKGGVITAFYNPDNGKSWGIYYSPDGTILAAAEAQNSSTRVRLGLSVLSQSPTACSLRFMTKRHESRGVFT
jgi:hypothetical protein